MSNQAVEPYRYITRIELATILGRALKKEAYGVMRVKERKRGYKHYVKALEGLGIVDKDYLIKGKNVTISKSKLLTILRKIDKYHHIISNDTGDSSSQEPVARLEAMQYIVELIKKEELN